jgi:hypothetical protein
MGREERATAGKKTNEIVYQFAKDSAAMEMAAAAQVEISFLYFECRMIISRSHFSMKIVFHCWRFVKHLKMLWKISLIHSETNVFFAGAEK